MVAGTDYYYDQYRLNGSYFGGINPYAFNTVDSKNNQRGPIINPSNPYNNNVSVNPPKQKTGFWEGVGAFCKGLVKPIVNMVKHPIKTVLFVAGAAALIVATGGAATPFLIGAGLTLGGYQVVKGSYKAITADTREETLAALEDVGEGTFTVAASVAGAKSYASGTSAGSATAAAAKESGKLAKFGAYTKGLAQDSWTVLKEVPGSAKTTFNMIKSGEAVANLQSYAGSAKLAVQHRNLAKTRLKNHSNSPEYISQKLDYDNNVSRFNAAMDKRAEAVAERYLNMLGKAELQGQPNTTQFNSLYDHMGNILDNKSRAFVNAGNLKTIRNNMNIFRNLPEENMAIGYASMFGNDNEDEFIRQAQQYAPVMF